MPFAGEHRARDDGRLAGQHRQNGIAATMARTSA
jgi:hypothetical protein